jgi:murein DD-endopeptidase MepM/ murein hydrolase activator NlpD
VWLVADLLRNRYIVYVTRAEDGTVERVPIPMKYVYVFLIAAVTGMITIVGLAGSYSRMLVKAESINSMREELAKTRANYAHLEKTVHEKDKQAASLSNLASQISAIYGLTAGKITRRGAVSAKTSTDDVANAQLRDTSATMSDEDYYKSLNTFYALKNTASDGLGNNFTNTDLGVRATLASVATLDSSISFGNIPDTWPVLGPINSGFGEREDPVLGGGEGEFHKGVDIGSPDGTPIHAPAGGLVIKADMGGGYGREIVIDHGNGLTTIYGHLQGWNVYAGQAVVKGQIIGYVGHSGRVTGSHLHYEVRVQGTAVNPHTYLPMNVAQTSGASATEAN